MPRSVEPAMTVHDVAALPNARHHALRISDGDRFCAEVMWGWAGHPAPEIGFDQRIAW